MSQINSNEMNLCDSVRHILNTVLTVCLSLLKLATYIAFSFICTYVSIFACRLQLDNFLLDIVDSLRGYFSN